MTVGQYKGDNISPINMVHQFTITFIFIVVINVVVSSVLFSFLRS